MKHPPPGFMGFHENYFAFSDLVQPDSLYLDSEMRVWNSSFYSCDIFSGEFRSILTTPTSSNCFEVAIHLLSYDRKARSAVKPIPPELPMAFFAEVNSDLEPLSALSLRERFGDFSMFIHGDPWATPVKLAVEKNVAYAIKRPYRDAVGFCGDELVFGPRILPVTLKLNSQWQILHGPFYSCDISEFKEGSVRGILQRVSSRLLPHCFRVKVYLLPYDSMEGILVVDKPVLLLDGDESGDSNILSEEV